MTGPGNYQHAFLLCGRVLEELLRPVQGGYHVIFGMNNETGQGDGFDFAQIGKSGIGYAQGFLRETETGQQIDHTAESAFDYQALYPCSIVESELDGGDAAQGAAHNEKFIAVMAFPQDLSKVSEYAVSVGDHTAEGGYAAAGAVTPVVCYKEIDAQPVIEGGNVVMVIDYLSIAVEVDDGG